MFRSQNQNNGSKNKDVRKEIEAENKKKASGENIKNSILNTGNENAGKLLLASEENDNDLFGSFDDIINNADKAPAEENKKAPAVQKNIDNEEDDKDELFGGFLTEVKKDVKKEVKKEANKEVKNSTAKEYGKKDPAKNLYPGDKPARQIFYEDPADLQEKLQIEGNEADFYKEGLLDLEDGNSLKQQGGKKIDPDSWRAGSTKKSKKKDDDLKKVSQTQERIAGLNIAVQKLDKRNKGGRFSRFLTNLAIFAGSTLGAALNWVGAIFKRAFSSKYRSMYRRGQSKDTNVPEIEQDERRHDLIPGWNGETYQKGPDGKDDILADFRRIPTVWSRLTAGQAEDKNGKPLAPKISIYIRQGKEAEDKSVNGTDPGHAGLGIEYSRYSLRSNRYERYNLRYGFFPGSQETTQGSLAMTGDARIPGQLKNERGNAYTISRTFPATAKQVNAVLKASETYADKGYNTFNRNCTTFVKDMIQHEAGIPAGDAIFEQETPGFSSLINFAMFAAKSSENTAKASVEKRFARLGKEEDLNYGGEGNKRINQQDYRNYKESLAESKGGYINKADLPNAAAENMRRLEGEETGTIGSRQYIGTASIDPDGPKAGSSAGSSGDAPILKPELISSNIRGAIENESNSLIHKILEVTRKSSIEELCGTPGIDKDAAVILGQINNYGTPLNQVRDDIRTGPENLRNARSALEKEVNDLNTLLFSFFKNDARLHLPIMHMISLLEYGIKMVDDLYEDVDLGKDAGGDLKNIRAKMDSKVIDVKYEKKENNEKKKVTAKLTPSRYEAYLQIYKSPHKAIDNASLLQELRRKKNRTKDEEAQYQKLERIVSLAWQYDAAHRYMLEKNSYNQQDVNYAFSLEKLEQKEKITGPMLSFGPSGVYKSLILEKIFGGVTDRLENEFTFEEVQDKNKLQPWLENDMVTCIQRKPDEMKAVIRGIKKATPEISEKELLEKLMVVIKKDWIDNVFNLGRAARTEDKRSPMKRTGDAVPEAFEKIAKGSQFTEKLEGYIHEVFVSDLSQNPIIELD